MIAVRSKSIVRCHISEEEILTLSDGVIRLRPLQSQDTAALLAGEDDEIATWLSGGRSTDATVRLYIARSVEEWQKHGPRRAYGIFDCTAGSLIGSVETNSALAQLKYGQINVSYSVFAAWRGRGVAVRALHLICEYLRTSSDAGQVIIRASPRNQASIRVAEKAGFQLVGMHDESDGPMSRYALDLNRFE